MTTVVKTTGTPTRTLKSWRAIDVDLTITVTPIVQLISGASTGENVIADEVYTTYSAAVTDTNAQLTTSAPCSFTSTNPAIATVSPSGFVQRVADGTVGIICTTSKGWKRVDVTVSRSAPGPVTKWTRFADGSLAKHICDAIDSRVAGKTGTAKPLYSTLDHVTPAYVRNVGCWAASLDLSSISPYNQTQPTRYTGTLITRRHVAFANHFQLPTNVPVRFITPDNQIVERQLTAKSRVGTTDLMIGVLNGEVPASIGFCKILPSNWRSYLPHYSRGIPGFTCDQDEKALVTEFYSISGADPQAQCQKPTDTQRAVFYEDLISGDSGNPFCFVVNGDLVIVTCWFSGGAGSGPAYMDMQAAINAKLAELSPGGGYSITYPDLSAFPTY